MTMPNPRITPEPSPYLLPVTICTFLQELANAAAVKVEGDARSGVDSLYAMGVLRTCSIPLSLHHGVAAAEVQEEAIRRAKEIFSTGQDWQRELKLYKSLLRYNQL
jgi:hypothetical protein